MENEHILSGLTELLEEQKQNLKQVNAIKSVLQDIDTKINELEKKISSVKPVSTFDGNQMFDELNKEIKKLQMQISNLPINVRHEKRILLFPEHEAKEYYAVILRWVLYIIIATYGFCLLKYLMDSIIR